MTQPIARPGDDDPGIEHATEEVVASWEDATPDKEPSATPADFARMRDGFGQAAERGTDADPESPA